MANKITLIACLYWALNQERGGASERGYNGAFLWVRPYKWSIYLQIFITRLCVPSQRCS